MSGGYSVSLFTDWQRDRINEVWIKSRVDSDSGGDGKRTVSKDLFGARPATKNLHPIAELSAEHCTEQLGVPGPWFERLPHFRMGFTPSSGKELQSEYFVPRQHAVEAMLAIQQAAFAALRPGRTCSDVEAEVQSEIGKLGFSHLTRHHTGHGMGLEGHESPFLDLGDSTVIAPGMVFSVEPGLYVPGVAGFRHSDTALVTEDGIELATYYPRDLGSLIV